MKKYSYWLYTLAMVLITCAIIWSNICLRQERSRLTKKRAQLIEQIEQMKAQVDEAIAETLRRSKFYKERIKNHELEQEVLDDIINNRLSIHIGLTHISDPFGGIKGTIKY